MTLFLFAATVLIWGTTWIAIAFQIGPVAPLVSVFYRFALAAVLLLAGLALSGRLRLPARGDRIWILAQGLCLFSLNFLCFYYATARIPSGLSSVIFSLATLANAVNARIFFGERIEPRVLVAAVVGVSGVALMFRAELAGQGLTLRAAQGIGLAMLGTTIFSLGNMVSRRNSAAGIGVMQANGWGMACGAVILAGLIGLSATPVTLPDQPRYLGALVYLAVIGSIAGFGAYLGLVRRIGTARAAYATVMFPVIALMLSAIYEGYVWTPLSVLGLALALSGNLVLFAGKRR